MLSRKMFEDYPNGKKVCISVKSLAEKNADLEYTDIISDYDDEGKFYMLYNDDGELCCLDGECCEINHVTYDGVYDLVNRNGETDVHFMLSKHDLDIAVFS